MKNNFNKILLPLLISGLFFMACKKDEKIISFLGYSDTLKLSSDKVDILPLSLKEKNLNAVTFTWNNPNYKFNNGVSSQDVSYVLQVDSTNGNFSSSSVQTLPIEAKSINANIKQGDLNKAVIKLGYTPKTNTYYNIYVRLQSSLNNVNATKTYSNVLNFRVAPYEDFAVLPPLNLFIVGDATPGGWSNPVPAAQKFNKLDTATFQLTLQLNANKSYLLLPTNGQWAKFNVPDKTAPGITLGGSFLPEQKDDIPSPADAGLYKITVDFRKGIFKLEKQ